MTSARFRVGLVWVHGVDSVRALIPYGEVYISKRAEGWEIEINGDVLYAVHEHKDQAMEHASDLISEEYEFWLETMTNASETICRPEPKELIWLWQGDNTRRAITPIGTLDLEWVEDLGQFKLSQNSSNEALLNTTNLDEAKRSAQSYFDLAISSSLESQGKIGARIGGEST